MDNSPPETTNEEITIDNGRERTPDQGGSVAVACSGYHLFNRQRPVHQIIGGGKAADVILWKRRWLSIAVIIVATVVWLIFELSGLSFLTICSDVLLILIVIQFVRSNSATFMDKQLQPLPELVLSEELVNSVAASFRVKVNSMLLVAHDITLGKDFKLFFQVVAALWLLSVIGSFFSFITLAYAGVIILITVPALYNRYVDHVDRYAGIVHQNISKHYKVVDENVIKRLPNQFSKSKDT